MYFVLCTVFEGRALLAGSVCIVQTMEDSFVIHHPSKGRGAWGKVDDHTISAVVEDLMILPLSILYPRSNLHTCCICLLSGDEVYVMYRPGTELRIHV